MSLRVISVPLVFLLMELGESLNHCRFMISYTPTLGRSNNSGLIIATPVLLTFGSEAPKIFRLALWINNIRTALVLISLGTTVITTSLIGYRVYIVTRLDGGILKNRFKKVVLTIIESSAVSSIILLILAISTVIPSFDKHPSMAELYAQYYIQAMSNGISVSVASSIRHQTSQCISNCSL